MLDRREKHAPISLARGAKVGARLTFHGCPDRHPHLQTITIQSDISCSRASPLQMCLGICRPPLERPIWLLFAAIYLAGCASDPRAHDLLSPATIRSPVSSRPIQDGRARFRQIFCGRVRVGLPSNSDPCDGLLWDLRDEGFRDSL